jgi:putative transposase
MADSYQIKNQDAIYYLTFQVINWIDVFTKKTYRDIIIDSFKYCKEHKALNLHAFVIMSNHVHCILSSGKSDLSGTIRDFKTFTSKTIISEINSSSESRREWMLGQMRYYPKTNKRIGLGA